METPLSPIMYPIEPIMSNCLLPRRSININPAKVNTILVSPIITELNKDSLVAKPPIALYKAAGIFLTWNTIDIVNKLGGVPIQSKSGHAFIKEKMRLENAIYGGEMSAHHYFKDFFYCDSGMIPWLLVMELVCQTRKPLSKLVGQMIEKYPSPGEINFQVKEPESSLERVKKNFESSALSVDYTDGISMEFESWRFNLRTSNTEPLVRLNIESRSDQLVIEEYVNKINSLL